MIEVLKKITLCHALNPAWLGLVIGAYTMSKCKIKALRELKPQLVNVDEAVTQNTYISLHFVMYQPVMLICQLKMG